MYMLIFPDMQKKMSFMPDERVRLLYSSTETLAILTNDISQPRKEHKEETYPILVSISYKVVSASVNLEQKMCEQKIIGETAKATHS